MSNLLDNICKIRDILEYKRDDELKKALPLFRSVFNELHRHIAKRTKDAKHETDFMSQDLREMSASIRATLNRWNTQMNPEKNIKALKKTIVDGKLDLTEFAEEKLKYIKYRREYTQMLVEFLNLCEFHSVFLYFLEEQQNDEFALKHTDRF